jgi:hypothetical protein
MGIRREFVQTTIGRKTWQWWPPVILTRNWAGYLQSVPVHGESLIDTGLPYDLPSNLETRHVESIG